MRTKFHIITGGESHEVSPTDIKNWDEVKFTLERKDFSGVMRSFSSDFEFVGDAFTLLRDLYLADGFLASAEIAVSTKNNDWTYTEQFRCPLDFSTIEIEDGVVTISSIDNTLSGLLKAQKSTKYEFPVDSFDSEQVEVKRMVITNAQSFAFAKTSLGPNTFVDLAMTSDLIVTTEYIEPRNEQHDEPLNEFFAKVAKIGATMSVSVRGKVRCYFSPLWKNTGTYTEDIPIGYLKIRTLQVDQSQFVQYTTLFDDDIMHRRINGINMNMFLNGTKEFVFKSLNELKASRNVFYNGMFGVVGDETYYYGSAYWENNTIYEYQNGNWINKGQPAMYYQDRNVGEGYGNGTASIGTNLLTEGCFVQLWCEGKMEFLNGTMQMRWDDPVSSSIYCRALTADQVATKIVQAISPSASVEIDPIEIFDRTKIIAGEELRQISGAKLYSTFQQFCDWIESVFGYSYRVEGNVVHFMHRSSLFGSDVVKLIDTIRDFKYSINTEIIYAEVQAGYSKKEYGEINGRYETNFTNYYTTGYNATDKKLQLISKYRADSYGIEYTIRKGDSESKDDKADEDVFVVSVLNNTYMTYNTIYRPEVCIANNAAFIAALGNGKAITLTMTSSDGNNGISNVEIEAGTALFTAGVVEFKTDDMDIPEDWDGLIQVDHGGYRYRGYISKAEATCGRTAGVEYTLIVKDITKL